MPLTGWKIRDSGDKTWTLDATDGTVQPAQTVSVRRRGRPMWLNNSGGDKIILLGPDRATVDEKAYGDAPSGKVFTFE